MIKNNFKIAWRSLWKNKTFSLINILGLSVALAAAILIGIWVMDEFNCDQSYEKKERIYEVYNRNDRNGYLDCWNTTPKPMARALKTDYPEIEEACRVYWLTKSLFSYKEKKLKAQFNIVDSNFLEVFTFPLVKGSKAAQFKSYNSIIITEELEKNLFEGEDAMEKIIMIDLKPYVVTGVLKNYTDKSRFQFDCLLPWSVMKQMDEDDDNWSNNSTMTYAMLYDSKNINQVQNKVKHLRKKYDKDSPDMGTFFYPLTRARLYGRFENGVEVGDRIVVVKMFSITSLLILLIACINFMNLSTARSDKRAKEVGIRKVAGASKNSLILQFLIESMLTSFLALILAMLMVKLSFHYFNDLAGKNIVLDLFDWKILFGTASFTLLTGILAGSYPAWYLSNFEPVVTLKGNMTSPKTLITPRKILILLQFIFSTFLIIATIVINKELKFIQSRDSGYDKKDLVYHFLEGDMAKNSDLIKADLIREGLAISVTKTSAPITEGWSNSDGMAWSGKDESQKTIVDRYCADDKVVQTMGLRLLAGRDLDLATYKTDSSGMIINQSMAKLMGHQNPDQALGKTIDDNGRSWTIIGVVEDFILHSPFGGSVPLVIQGAHGWFNILHVKYTNKYAIKELLSKVEKVFTKYNPAYPFEFKFVDEAYAKKFEDANKIAKMSTMFAGFSIFISCLGMFGLISFMAVNRRKEIAIRKVNGASIKNLLVIISMEFIKIITLAFILAIPISVFLMKKWLMQYRHQIELSWSIFAFAALILITITFLTIGYQTLKAAFANPINSLRSE